MATTAEIYSNASTIAQYLVNEKIHPAVATRFGLIAALMLAYEIAVPRITSGFRSLARQAELHDQGYPTAQRSWHTEGLALDLDPDSPTLPLFGLLWEALGGRDGKNFLTPDPGHFDFPIQWLTPQAAY